MTFRDKYGPWAFITGGSEGIGAEIGNTLAASGVNICMVARNEAALLHQQAHLQSTYGVEVICQTADLTKPETVSEIIELSSELDIGFYAHVASMAALQPYLETSPERHRASLQINVISVHELSYHFANRMKQRGSGGVMLCSSMASLLPFPNNAQYSAVKGYMRLLGEALWFELKDHNVDALALTISEVSTPALLRSGSKMQNNATTRTPKQVVDEAFSVFGKQPGLITGRVNRILAFITTRFVPKTVMMKVYAREIQNYKEPPAVH